MVASGLAVHAIAIISYTRTLQDRHHRAYSIDRQLANLLGSTRDDYLEHGIVVRSRFMRLVSRKSRDVSLRATSYVCTYDFMNHKGKAGE